MFQGKQNDVIKCCRMPRFVLSTVLLPLLSVYSVYSTENIFMLVFKGTRYILCWIMMSYVINWGFTGSSAGKESACNSGDPGSIIGLGNSPGEGIGYPLQYSWASLVAQMVKNHLQCRRPRFDPWIGKDSLEEGMATHSSILA